MADFISAGFSPILITNLTMVPIKIQCECGQRYAFEIEPVNGRMPSAVTCPSCGADGTAAANVAIAQSQQQAAAPAATGATLRVSTLAQPSHAGISVAPGRPAPRRP